MSLEDIPYCDVFYPTEDEFKNFEKYVSKCHKSSKSGVFKVVPPRTWKPKKDQYKNLEFTIPFPIEQVVTGSSGVYEVFLIQREARSLNKYRKLVESFDSLTEGKKPIEIEKLFWKNLKLSAPLYGADSPGSIFDSGVSWNLAELDTLLKKGLDAGGILGVTSPYIYIGAWKTLFAWHKEDMDLFSINYVHLGKPKYWYAIPLEDSVKFEDYMKKSFPEANKECPEFLRHKTYLVHPEVLIKQGIRLHKCVQSKGEFVITKAGGYHSGFNSGFNVAEAVNFALKSWIDVGKNAKSCKCRGDSVKINMDDFVSNLKRRSRSPNSTSSNSSFKKEKAQKLLKCANCLKLRKIPKKFILPLGTDFTCDMLKKSFCDVQEEKPKRKYSRINKTIRKKNSTKSKNNYQIKKLKPYSRKSKLKKIKESKQRHIPKRRYVVKVRG